MPFHTGAPPPSFHHSPVHVFAASSRSGRSNGFDGSPGTVQNCQACLPVSASKAEKKPRTPYSPPLTPIMTFPPLITRGAIVIVYGMFSGDTRVSHTIFPV